MNKKKSFKKTWIKYKNIYIKRIIEWLCIVFVCILPLVMNFFLEMSDFNFNFNFHIVNSIVFDKKIVSFLISSILLMSILLLLIVISGYWWVGTSVFVVLFSLIIFANHQKIMFRREPIYPEDITVLFEPKMLYSMLGKFAFFGVIIMIALIISVLIWGFVRNIKAPLSIQLLRVTGLIVASVVIMLFMFFNYKNNPLKKFICGEKNEAQNQQIIQYQNVGFVGGFFLNVNPEAMEFVQGYSESKIEEIVAKYNVEKTYEDKGEMPNIVFILSESYSDPSRLEGIEIEGDPIQYFRELCQETYSGNMFSVGYGGGTANIEFEALTGFSMEPLNSGISPYPLVVAKRKDFPSIISYLKQNQYYTAAIHPFDLSMYKRNSVYKSFGFDTIMGEGDMKYKDRIYNNPYVSDKSAFKQTLELLEGNKKEPNFVNLITMQAHMPYEGKYSELRYGLNSVERDGEIINYIEDISHVTEAYQEFINEVNKLERRTIIVFYGDHLPGIYGKDILEKNTYERMHETPFMIYDNRNIITGTFSEAFVVSPIFFTPIVLKNTAIPINGFYNLLDKLFDILPAFEKKYFYEDFQWGKSITDKKAKEIYNDYKLIEYDVVQGKNYSGKLGFFNLNN